jgi:hypothetical protein
MAVRVGPLVFRTWQSLSFRNGWSDTFYFPMSPGDGLPPRDYAEIVRLMAHTLARLRRGASIWVSVENLGGEWFREEVRRALLGLPVSVVVTAGLPANPELAHFSYVLGLDRIPPPPPPCTPDLYLENIPMRALCCLRALARMESAYTAEVASQAAFSLPVARRALVGLQDRGLVSVINGKYPAWQIRRPGLSLALRSWGLPPGVPFRSRCERRSSGGRHLRTLRLWPAWLRRAWPQAEVWAGWSEVAFGRLRPDALAWGRLDGQEVLFWLEVESGHASREELQRKTLHRFNQALVYARSFPVRLVFVLLGLPWVLRSAVTVFRNLPIDAIVVLEDWKSFGFLPVPGWGEVHLSR